LIKLIVPSYCQKIIILVIDFVIVSQLRSALLYSDAPISYAVPSLVALQTICRKYDTLNWDFRIFPVTFSYRLHYSNRYRTYTKMPLHRLNLLLKAIPLFFHNDKRSLIFFFHRLPLVIRPELYHIRHFVNLIFDTSTFIHSKAWT